MVSIEVVGVYTKYLICRSNNVVPICKTKPQPRQWPRPSPSVRGPLLCYYLPKDSVATSNVEHRQGEFARKAYVALLLGPIFQQIGSRWVFLYLPVIWVVVHQAE